MIQLFNLSFFPRGKLQASGLSSWENVFEDSPESLGTKRLPRILSGGCKLESLLTLNILLTLVGRYFTGGEFWFEFNCLSLKERKVQHRVKNNLWGIPPLICASNTFTKPIQTNKSWLNVVTRITVSYFII